jgi:hypothetical protein
MGVLLNLFGRPPAAPVVPDPVDIAHDRTCPYCNASPGQKCINGRGEMDIPHQLRLDLAEETTITGWHWLIVYEAGDELVEQCFCGVAGDHYENGEPLS